MPECHEPAVAEPGPIGLHELAAPSRPDRIASLSTSQGLDAPTLARTFGGVPLRSLCNVWRLCADPDSRGGLWSSLLWEVSGPAPVNG